MLGYALHPILGYVEMKAQLIPFPELELTKLLDGWVPTERTCTQQC